jgi:hypothetical protein
VNIREPISFGAAQLDSDRLATRWEIDEALGVVLLDGHHRPPPAWAALSLNKGGRLVEAHHVQLLSHQCMRHKPNRPEDVVDNLYIIMVDVEVVVVNVIINIRIVVRER